MSMAVGTKFPAEYMPGETIHNGHQVEEPFRNGIIGNICLPKPDSTSVTSLSSTRQGKRSEWVNSWHR